VRPILNLSAHRHWEDWCCLALGAVILVSPVIAQTVDFPSATLNALLVGLLLMLLAWQELMLFESWEDYLELGLGLWLIASPWVFGYSHLGFATAMHVVLGTLVAALAVLEFYQDRRAAHPRAA